MQNTRQLLHFANSSQNPVRRTCLSVFGACIAILVLLIALSIYPYEALANEKSDSGEYSILSTSINATIQTDGSLNVVERRLFSFEQGRTKIGWKSDAPGGSIDVIGVSIAPMSSTDQSSVDFAPLSKVVFNVGWRNDGGPEGDVYSFDVEKEKTYAFFDVDSDYVLMQFEYTLPDAVKVYNDCAELRWTYMESGQWSSPSENVDCTVSFPVPYEDWPVVGQDVYAWCHGPEGTDLSFDESVNSVSFWQSRIESDGYAEARILVPAHWISNASDSLLAAHSREVHKDSVLEEEREWVDWDAVGKTEKLQAQIAFGIASLLLVVAALVLYVAFGRNHKNKGEDASFDLIGEGIHPVLAGRVWRWNRYSSSDFAVTVMRLARIGALSINCNDVAVEDEAGCSQVVRHYYLAEARGFQRENLDAIDEYAMHFIFDVVGKGASSVWIDAFADYAKEFASEFSESAETWNLLIDREIDELGLFEKKGLRLQKYMAGVGFLYFAMMLIAWLFMGSGWLVAFGAITCLILYSISNLMGRRSARGAQIYRSCQDLRTRLSRIASGEAEVGLEKEDPAKLMELAFQFGLAPEMIARFAETKAEEYQREVTLSEECPGYVPWFWWYLPSGGDQIPVCQQIDDIMTNAQENTEWSLKKEIKRLKDGFRGKIRKLFGRLFKKSDL